MNTSIENGAVENNMTMRMNNSKSFFLNEDGTYNDKVTKRYKDELFKEKDTFSLEIEY